jgi:hypothetical protein
MSISSNQLHRADPGLTEAERCDDRRLKVLLLRSAKLFNDLAQSYHRIEMVKNYHRIDNDAPNHVRVHEGSGSSK